MRLRACWAALTSPNEPMMTCEGSQQDACFAVPQTNLCTEFAGCGKMTARRNGHIFDRRAVGRHAKKGLLRGRIPKPHRTVEARGENMGAIFGIGNGGDCFCMAFKGTDALAGCNIP